MIHFAPIDASRCGLKSTSWISDPQFQSWCSGAAISASNGVQFVDANRAGCAAVVATHGHSPPIGHTRLHVSARAERARLRSHRAARFLPTLFAGFAAGFRPSPLDFARADRCAA